MADYLEAYAIRFRLPEGGLYLWCQLPADVRASDVQRHAFADGVVFVAGDVFYVDRGGAHEMRVCYTAQPVEKAVEAARSLARSIAATSRIPAAM